MDKHNSLTVLKSAHSAETEQTCLDESGTVTEYNLENKRENIKSIFFAFIVVYIFFTTVFFLKYFEKLTFDNIVILAVVVFSICLFWVSHRKNEVNEVTEFKEPKI